MKNQIQRIRDDFPMLSRTVYGHPLVYLDNAATAQKPKGMVEEMSRIYLSEYGSVHRGAHYFNEKVTEAYEGARSIVCQHINGRSSREIVFTRSATDSVNLIAFSFGETFVNEGDEILVSEMEHHSNIVPWYMLCKRRKAKLKVIPFDDNGEIRIEEMDQLLSPKVKLVSIAHASNTLGTINPLKKIITKAHDFGIPVIVDGAQSIPHMPIDVQDLDCDFFVFSGHKVFGPTGIGVLYGKEEYLSKMCPYQGGGSMIKSVTIDNIEYDDLPLKFEAGTPNFVGAIGLGYSLKYIQNIGLEKIVKYEQLLLAYATEKLNQIGGMQIFGKAFDKVALISFLIDGVHSYDLGACLDKMGIAVRTGMHCAQPVMDHFKIKGVLRISLAFYNTTEEIDILVASINRALKLLK